MIDNEYSLNADIAEIAHLAMSVETASLKSLARAVLRALCDVRDGKVTCNA